MLWNQVQWGGGEVQRNPFSQIRWHDFEPYFGDTWKLRRNLTLEYGFRWSFLRMPYSGPDMISNFVPRLYNPALGNDPCNGVVLPPGTDFCTAAGFSPGFHGQNRSLKDQNNHAIAPRIGLAWDPRGDGKMSIRAGIGQFFQRERLNNTLQMATNPPYSLTVGYQRALDAVITGNLSASGTPGFAQDTRDILPNTWQWNLTVEREVFRDTKFELAYVGNRGVHLLGYFDANQVPFSLRQHFALNNSATDRPFGAGSWGAINFANWGYDSNYHALQALFRSRVRSLDAQFAYTWSKSLSNTDIANSGNVNQFSLELDPANTHLNYGPTSLNRPHIFTSNVVYDLPGLRGQNSFMRTALGGWQLTGIVSYASGPSMSAFASRTFHIATNPSQGTGGLSGSGASQDSLRPLLVPGQPCRATGGPKQNWINPNRYTLNGYVVGSLTGTAAVGDCYGPPISNTDMGVYKNFKAGERVNIQFRMDFFNLFNHVQFTGNSSGRTDINATLNTDALTCPTNPGVICSTTVNSSFGVATKTKGPREIQYGLKLTF
jgi:hypothetical protein